MREPDAILSADWHLRDDVPICRTDDYWHAQEEKVRFVLNLQREHGHIPLLIAGDLLNKAKSSPYLEAWAIEQFVYVDGRKVVVPGQHDLPNHSLALYGTSSLAVLDAADAVEVWRGTVVKFGRDNIFTFPYGKKIIPCERTRSGKRICLAHYMVRKGKELWPGMPAERARSLLDRMDYDLIVTGDNHQPFVAKREGKLLVNPGSLKRDEADQIDHRPRVYLWYAKENEVEPVYLPIQEGIISREHLDRETSREERTAAFVQRLDDDYEVHLSYKRNLKAHMAANETRMAVKDLVWEWMDG